MHIVPFAREASVFALLIAQPAPAEPTIITSVVELTPGQHMPWCEPGKGCRTVAVMDGCMPSSNTVLLTPVS